MSKLSTATTRIVLPYLLLGLSLLCVFVLYCLQHPVFQSYFFQSDTLYLPTLFQDILKHHGHIQDWYLTPAPYFFPDYFLFLIPYALVNTVSAQMIVYTLSQVMLLSILLYFFFKSLATDAYTCAILSAIVMLWLALNATGPFPLLLMSAFHFGTFLIEIASLTLCLHFLDSTNTNQKTRVTLILCSLSFITTYSDALFFTQFIIPASLSYFVIQWLFQKKITQQPLFILLPLSGLIGYVSYPLLIHHPTRYSNQIGFSHFDNNLHQLIDIMRELFTHAPVTSLYILMFYLVSFIVCCFFVINKKSRGRRKTILFLLFLIQISTWGSICSMLLITHFTPTARYLIPAVNWPIIMGILFLFYGLKRYFYPFALSCMILVVISFCLNIQSLSKEKRLTVDYYPNDVACIDHGLNQYPALHHGIAQYWDAKFIQNYSRHSLVLAQYYGNLAEHIFITSRSFYRPTYDFAIISNHVDPIFTLSREKLKQYNQAPLDTIHCEKHDLLIYGQDKLRLSTPKLDCLHQ